MLMKGGPMVHSSLAERTIPNRCEPITCYTPAISRLLRVIEQQLKIELHCELDQPRIGLSARDFAEVLSVQEVCGTRSAEVGRVG